ncbi:MAG TPA: 2-oxoglutarate synthase [Candidatus Marinimicrobia bacterium]|jgi:pyruvate/2-oxoacid:ferredoxin oxidoreductase beta subunit/Pyruvate/2-oxoacid:ferredoxin oxidoreductase gamma subunit|nr:2-oxoglutarate synthase [Candidatus Neomarinimicrobiota bacterium]HHZ99814.1 2-oxoglutarate synthase [Candidatus Neomarinimicrobiota bacterium]HIB02593.1 2-oxoglutarate synthase [Candidatus Neomarinimicrobiota bacterium]HIB70062.1 2-oxoglutarate synthase [Candidatus Neomarinimicrobiota bacterium]HIB95070.1 2-oxoglutarate synthase [Candidatus Neomarinimicrobiota bacterium]
MAEMGLDTYIAEENLPYEFCPGCSHGKVLGAVSDSLKQQELDPTEVVIVTDIGCVGLSDKYFVTHAFHGLHGRAITYASGIKMQNPDLKVVVLIGDGGCGIGGHHLLNAARSNTDIAVLVFNNFNFGMTGGQHSVTTPLDSITPTTSLGSTEAPMDIAGTAKVNGGGFIARATAFDKDLPEMIAKAMDHDGFSLIDIWELCTAYYVVRNDFGRKEMMSYMDSMNMESGILQETNRPSFQTSYKGIQEQAGQQKPMSGLILETKFTSDLDKPVRIVLAGAAGQKVVSAGNLLASAATLSGLWTSRRADFPITIQTGFSVAEIIISPEPVLYSGVIKPDVAALIAPEGRDKIARLTQAMDKTDTIYFAEGLGNVNSKAKLLPLAFPESAQKEVRKNISALTAGYLTQQLGLFPFEALQEATQQIQKPKIAKINLGVFAHFES